MTWNEATNVCGSAQAAAEAAATAAAAAPAVLPEKKKQASKKGEKKAVKKAKSRHGTKKVTVHKKPRHHQQTAVKKERRGFLKWLRDREKKS
jgi:hypothetical protein